MLGPPFSAADGIRLVSTLAHHDWANSRRTSCSSALTSSSPVNPGGCRSSHAPIASFHAGVLGSSEEPFSTPSICQPARRGAYRMVYAALDDPAEREAPEQEARSMGLVHSECWPAYAEAHNIETE
jgi:hypothetical protein